MKTFSILAENKLQFWLHPSIEWKRVLCVSAADRQTTGAMRPAAESAFGRSKVTWDRLQRRSARRKKSFQFFGESFQSVPSEVSSVLLFDVQRKGGRRHQPVAAAAAARHHGDAAPAVSVEAAASAAAGAGGRRGRGRGRGGLLELLLVDFTLFGPTILEPDLHLEVREKKLLLPELDESVKHAAVETDNKPSAGCLLPVSPIGWVLWPAPTSSWWWCTCCSETPFPAPAAGGRCKPPGICL